MNAQLVRDLLSYDPATGEFRWRVAPGGRGAQGSIAGTVDALGYVVIRHRGKGYKAHRLAWLHHYGEWPATSLDHINRQKGDNRIANLRECDATLNATNVVAPLPRSISGRRGVSWFAQYQKWKATIQYHGRKIFLGHFDDPAEAEEVYLLARAMLTGGRVA